MLEFRRLLEGLMGNEPVAAGEDTQWHVRFGLGWPDWILVPFFVAAVVFVVWIYLREGALASRRFKLFLATVRLMILGLVILMIGGLEILIDRTGLPYLVFMVDDSESMQVRDQQAEGDDSTNAQQPARIERVAKWFEGLGEDVFARTMAGHKLQLYAHASAPRLLGTYIDQTEIPKLIEDAQSLAADGSESRIGSNLRRVLNNLRGTPPSAVVLITDGVTTQGESLTQAAQYAARKNIPILTVGVGDPEQQRDLQLTDLLVDDTVFVDDVVSFEAKLVGRGLEGEEVAVTLRQQGVETPLDEKKLQVGADGEPVAVRVAHRPTDPGTIVYELEIPVQPRELRKDNNKIERSVRVIKEKVRVFYVESYPRYEFRYLKHLLEREPTIDLTVLLLEADPEYAQQDRVAVGFFPTNKQELYEYDVLILGDVPPSVFSEAQVNNIHDFVRTKGGGLLLIAGPRYSPQTYGESMLADLVPIEVRAGSASDTSDTFAEGFRPQRTLEGRFSPIFRFAADEEENDEIWELLPELYWYAAAPQAKPAAQVLAEHPTAARDGKKVPLIVSQYFGAGRTYYQGFDATWRWRYRVEDVYHARYWVQAVRYLARSKLLGKSRAVELMASGRRFQRHDPVQLRVRFLDESLTPNDDDGVAVLVTRNGYDQKTLKLSRLPGRRSVFETVLAQAADGRYRAQLTSPLIEGTAPTAEFEVVPPPGELDRVQLNEEELRQVATLTGGTYYPLSKALELFNDLPPGQRVALHTDPPFPLWRTWPVLTAFFLLLVLEWVLRKRKSMV